MFNLQLIQRAAFELIVLPVLADTSKAAAIASLKAIRWGAHITLNVCEFLLMWLVKLTSISLTFLLEKAKEHGPILLTYAAKLPSAEALPAIAIDAGGSAGLVVKPWMYNRIQSLKEAVALPWDVLRLAVDSANG